MTAAPHPRMHGLTHVCGGADPIPGICQLPRSAPGLADTIVGLLGGTDGFWPLNETSGTTAHDLSGNGYHMEPRAFYSPPVWANAATPYGENAPVFGGTVDETNTAVPALTGDLTVFCWAQKSTDIFCSLIGQGNPAPSGNPGVELVWANSSSLFEVLVGGGTGPHAITSNTGYTPGAGWHMVAATRASHVWTLYVDGAAQTGSYNDGGTNYTPDSGAWIGLNPTGTSSTAFHISYGATLHHALTAAEILNLWNTSTGPPTDGAVEGAAIVSNGDGTTSWQYPTKVAGTRYAEILAGTGITAHDNGDDTVTLSAAGSSPSDTAAWMPLTTVVGGTPDLVWDASDSLIPTYTPF